MANWAADFIEHHPELARWPVQRHRHALSFESPSGERRTFFVGAPAHWWSRAEGWQELDTRLRRLPSGEYGAPGLEVRIAADGTSTCGGYAQRTGRVGVLSGGGCPIGQSLRLRPLATLGPGRIDGDSLIREAPGFRHVLRVTETGLREELHVERDVAGDEADLLTVETQSRGTLPAGYRFGRPVGLVDGISLPLTQRGGWAGLPLRLVRAGAVLDPDYAADTADQYVTGNNAAYATARSTATGNTDSTVLHVGQDYSTSYYVRRSFLKFDTSAIGGDEISQVNLKMVCTTDNSDVNFLVLIKKCDWSGTDPITSGNRDTAFDNCLSSDFDLGIWRTTVGIATNTVYTSDNLATTWLNASGATYYGLISSEDSGNSAPAGQELIYLAAADHGTSGYRPVLTVEHKPLKRWRALLGVGA